MLYPTNYSLVSGFGDDEVQLVSFDKALFRAGVANYNLVKVSSILPSGCVRLSTITAKPGSMVYAAYAAYSSNSMGKISSAVGVGIPQNPQDIGVIMELSGVDNADVLECKVREMVSRSMYLRGIGIKEIETTSIETDVSTGRFTTVVSALIMW